MDKALMHTGGGKCERGLGAVARGREPSTEIFRVALMFGICLIHSIGKSGYQTPWMALLLMPCVNAFGFISGYYGVSFKPSKVFRLYGIAVFCGLLVVLLGVMGLRWEVGLDLQTLRMLCARCSGGWFLNAYVVMMCFAPLIDRTLETGSFREGCVRLLPFLLVAFGWSFLASLVSLQGLIPTAAGLGSHTPLTLIGAYAVGRLYRMSPLDGWLTWRRLAVALVCVVTLLLLRFGYYASPASMALAVLAFAVFRRVRWPAWLGRVAVVLGPSMFAVYVLHDNPLGYAFIWDWTEGLVATRRLCGPELAHIAVAAVIFVGCCVLDVPRRVFVRLAQPVLSRLLRVVDAWWASLTAAIKGEAR